MKIIDNIKLENIELQHKYILIVDDSAIIRNYLKIIVERLGYKVLTVASGKGCLEIVEKTDIKLILLDIVMSDMDGFATLEELKKRVKTMQIPVVMISGLDELDNIVKSIKLGADDYIPKSTHSELIEARIKAILVRSHFREMQTKYEEGYKTVQLAASLSDKLNSPLFSLINSFEAINRKFLNLDKSSNSENAITQLNSLIDFWDIYSHLVENSTNSVKEGLKELSKLRDTIETLETTEILMQK